MNLSPLLAILHRTSHGRILEDMSLESEGDLYRATIPIVNLVQGGESTESTLRDYATDWVVKNSLAPVRARCTFTRLEKPLRWKYDDGRTEEHPVVATLTLSWWPRPPALEEWVKPRPRQSD